MRDHKDLDVWKVSMIFVETIYCCSALFPKEEMYGLTSQIRRAAVSIPSNIAEGAARQGDKEFIQFLYIALGSVAEVETQIILALNLRFIANNEEILEEIIRIKKLLNGLIGYIKRKN